MNLFQWEDYLNLAEELSKQNNHAYSRCAVSRAYYGIYQLLKSKARLKPKKYRTVDSSHAEFIKELLNPTYELMINLDLEEEAIKQIGNTMEKLRLNRNDADYDSRVEISQKLAKEAVEDAKGILYIINNPYSY